MALAVPVHPVREFGFSAARFYRPRGARLAAHPPATPANRRYYGHSAPNTPAVTSAYTSASIVFFSVVLHFRLYQIESGQLPRA